MCGDVRDLLTTPEGKEETGPQDADIAAQISQLHLHGLGAVDEKVSAGKESSVAAPPIDTDASERDDDHGDNKEQPGSLRQAEAEPAQNAAPIAPPTAQNPTGTQQVVVNNAPQRAVQPVATPPPPRDVVDLLLLGILWILGIVIVILVAKKGMILYNALYGHDSTGDYNRHHNSNSQNEL